MHAAARGRPVPPRLPGHAISPTPWPLTQAVGGDGRSRSVLGLAILALRCNDRLPQGPVLRPDGCGTLIVYLDCKLAHHDSRRLGIGAVRPQGAQRLSCRQCRQRSSMCRVQRSSGFRWQVACRHLPQAQVKQLRSTAGQQQRAVAGSAVLLRCGVKVQSNTETRAAAAGGWAPPGAPVGRGGTKARRMPSAGGGGRMELAKDGVQDA